MKPSSEEIAYIAYHEAGHVVANYYLGWKVGEIYIMLINGKYGGVSAPLIDHDPRAYVLDISPNDYEFLVSPAKEDMINMLHNRAMVLIAGQSAENIYNKRSLVSLSDFTNYKYQDNRTDVGRLRVIEGQLMNYFDNDLNVEGMIANCNDIIIANWSVVKGVAEALLLSPGLGIDQSAIELLVADIKHR